MPHRAFRRAAAYAAALLVALSLIPIPAAATLRLQSTAKGTQTVSVATWGVTPSQTSLSYPALVGLFGGSFSQYLNVTNAGTRTLVGTTYAIGLASLSIGSLTLTLNSCSTTWATSTGVCTGGVVTKIKDFTGSASSIDSPTAPLAPGSVLHLQATETASIAVLALTVTISTSVSAQAPRDISAATITNH